MTSPARIGIPCPLHQVHWLSPLDTVAAFLGLAYAREEVEHRDDDAPSEAVHPTAHLRCAHEYLEYARDSEMYAEVVESDLRCAGLMGDEDFIGAALWRDGYASAAASSSPEGTQQP